MFILNLESKLFSFLNIFIFFCVCVCTIHPFKFIFLRFQEIQDEVISPEKAEEVKLKARYPNLGNKPGGSDLLRKRLQKGVS